MDTETTYVALLLECGPPCILFDYAPPTATVGDADKAREWFAANNIGYDLNATFYPWWSGYKKWYLESRVQAEGRERYHRAGHRHG